MPAQLSTWLARHAQTLLGSLGRIVQHPLATLMTMAVIAVALALPLFLDVFLQNLRSATADWNQAFDISVYMEKQAGGSRTQALAKEFRGRPDVANVRVITAEEGLTQFKASSGFGHALDALTDNPLPDALLITPALAASNPEGMAALKTALSNAAGVQTVQIDTDWVNRLVALLDIMRRIVQLTGGLLGLGVMLVIGNTIRLDILNRRSEIEVMKLVGATDRFARRPFLYSGVWYGLGGAILALALVAFAVALLAQPVARLAGLYGSQFRLRGLGFGESVTIVGGAIALGWLGSWFAATRHIKQIEPT